MELTIKIKIPSDQVYRDSLSPYDLNRADLKRDVMAALDDALYVMAGGGDNAVANVKHFGPPVGIIKVKAR